MSISPTTFDLLVAISRACATNDVGRVWLTTTKLNDLLFTLSGGDVRRLSADIDRLLAIGILEFRPSPPAPPRHPEQWQDWCYVNLPHAGEERS